MTPARLADRLHRHEAALVAGLLASGWLLRLGWLFLAPDERLRPHRSEMWNVAVAYARTGTLADAYAPGSGISSHVGPFNTILAGLIYRWFGVGSLPAELILAVAAATTTMALFWTLDRIAAELRIGIVPRLAALAFLTLVPINFYLEIVDFRIREAAFATLIGSAGLLWLLRLDAGGGVGNRALAGFGLLAGFAFLINPVVALPLYTGIGLVALRHVPMRRWPVGMAIGLAGLAAVNGAWVVREYRVYDRLMLSRGNFGLELDTANHDAAVAPADPRAVFVARSRAIHPSFSAAALARLKTYPNDVAYFDTLGAEAKAWIAANPGGFVRISLRHLRELYFPPQWQWNQYGDHPRRGVAALQAVKWAITALALAMLATGLLTRPRPWLFVAISLALPTLLYMILQPTLRYRYIFEGLFVFLAAEIAVRTVAWLARRRPA